MAIIVDYINMACNATINDTKGVYIRNNCIITKKDSAVIARSSVDGLLFVYKLFISAGLEHHCTANRCLYIPDTRKEVSEYFICNEEVHHKKSEPDIIVLDQRQYFSVEHALSQMNTSEINPGNICSYDKPIDWRMIQAYNLLDHQTCYLSVLYGLVERRIPVFVIKEYSPNQIQALFEISDYVPRMGLNMGLKFLAIVSNEKGIQVKIDVEKGDELVGTFVLPSGFMRMNETLDGFHISLEFESENTKILTLKNALKIIKQPWDLPFGYRTATTSCEAQFLDD